MIDKVSNMIYYKYRLIDKSEKNRKGEQIKKMPKKYRRLKARMLAMGYEQKDIAKHFGRSLSYISECLNAKNDGFNVVEINDLLDLLHIPDSEYGLYFSNNERQGK